MAILLEAQDPDAFRSGKTTLWYYYVRLLSHQGAWVTLPIAIAMLICTTVFARILHWCWCEGLRKSALVGLLLIAAAPHMVYFAGSLYPDALFAVASTGLLFEVWRMGRQRRIDGVGLAMLALTLPFAVFLRTNGIIFLIPPLALLVSLPGRQRYLLAAVISIWCTVAGLAHFQHRSSSQDALFSLTIFETANFLRPHAMRDLWNTYPKMNDPWVASAPRVSPRTVTLLREGLQGAELQAYTDPAYWDMLVFHPQGPQVGRLGEEQRKELVREFLRYNVWHNLPVFMGSRVTVFLTAFLAEGGYPALDYAKGIQPRLQGGYAFRPLHMTHLETAAHTVHQLSHAWRWILWAPWCGLVLAILLAWKSFRQNCMVQGAIAFALLAQIGAIFLFATAGEYRYLLFLFTAPLALWPMLMDFASSRSSCP